MAHPHDGPLAYATSAAGRQFVSRCAPARQPVPDPRFCEVSTTTNSREAAEELAESAVHARMAAGAQVVGPIPSRYRWEGRVTEAEEWLIHFNAPVDQSGPLREHIIECHSHW